MAGSEQGRGERRGEASWSGRSTGTDLKEEAQATAQQLKDSGREKLDQGKSAAADQAEALASAFDSAAERLSGSNETLASYAQSLSKGMSSVADHVRHRSLDELLSDAQSLARRNPTLFVLGSVGVGVMVSRFLKASASRAGQTPRDVPSVCPQVSRPGPQMSGSYQNPASP
jgi:hypothetical protein